MLRNLVQAWHAESNTKRKPRTRRLKTEDRTIQVQPFTYFAKLLHKSSSWLQRHMSLQRTCDIELHGSALMLTIQSWYEYILSKSFPFFEHLMIHDLSAMFTVCRKLVGAQLDSVSCVCPRSFNSSRMLRNASLKQIMLTNYDRCSACDGSKDQSYDRHFLHYE